LGSDFNIKRRKKAESWGDPLKSIEQQVRGGLPSEVNKKSYEQHGDENAGKGRSKPKRFT